MHLVRMEVCTKGRGGPGKGKAGGAVKWPNGANYEGRFKDDKIDGQGALRLEKPVPLLEAGGGGVRGWLVPVELKADLARVHQVAGFDDMGYEPPWVGKGRLEGGRRLARAALRAPMRHRRCLGMVSALLLLAVVASESNAGAGGPGAGVRSSRRRNDAAAWRLRAHGCLVSRSLSTFLTRLRVTGRPLSPPRSAQRAARARFFACISATSFFFRSKAWRAIRASRPVTRCWTRFCSVKVVDSGPSRASGRSPSSSSSSPSSRRRRSCPSSGCRRRAGRRTYDRPSGPLSRNCINL